jgi:K+-transporting ATPase KdpF subunit
VTVSRGHIMNEFVLGLVVAVALGVYLLYALVHPEKF